MMTANIIERYNTTLGTIIVVPADRMYRVGDKILVENEQRTISNILLPSRPTENAIVSLVIT